MSMLYLVGFSLLFFFFWMVMRVFDFFPEQPVKKTNEMKEAAEWLLHQPLTPTKPPDPKPGQQLELFPKDGQFKLFD